MLTVEDGTGLTSADSYVSMAEANAYHALYGNAEWPAEDDEAKELLLRRASRDIDFLYGPRFSSRVLVTSQGLLWPRVAYYKDAYTQITGVPKALKDATAELALVYSTQEDGYDMFTAPEADVNVKSKTEKLDVLERSVEYWAPPAPSSTAKLSRVNAILGYLFGNNLSGSWAQVVR